MLCSESFVYDFQSMQTFAKTVLKLTTCTSPKIWTVPYIGCHNYLTEKLEWVYTFVHLSLG